MKRRRLKTWAKWACTAAAGLCIAAAVVSRFWIVEYIWYTPGRAGIREGAFGEGLFSGLREDDWVRSLAGPKPGWAVGRVHGWNWGTAAEAAPLGGGARGGAGLLWLSYGHYARVDVSL